MKLAIGFFVACLALIAGLVARALIIAPPIVDLDAGGTAKIACDYTKEDIDAELKRFANHMVALDCDLSKVNIDFTDGKIQTRWGKYNGVTWDATRIEVNCKDMTVRQSALLYECLNACLWAKHGYDVAIAEAPPSEQDTPAQAASKAIRAPYKILFDSME